jgi:hypothetical protein
MNTPERLSYLLLLSPLNSNAFACVAFVVMPDHWNALFLLIEPWTLPQFMLATMSFIGAKTARILATHR